MAVPRVVNPISIALPGQNVGLTADPHSQPVAPWWQVFYRLVARTGGNVGVDAAALAANVSGLDILSALAANDGQPGPQGPAGSGGSAGPAGPTGPSGPGVPNPFTGTVTTNDATATTIATVAIATNSAVKFAADFAAFRTGGTSGTTGDSGGFRLQAFVKNIAGTVTIVNQVDSYTQSDQGTWTVTAAVSGTNIVFQVTGAANNTVDWAVSGQAVVAS